MTSAEKKEYLKRYQIENKDRIAEQRKKYREQNKEKIAEQKRRYAEKNPEKIKIAQSLKYQKHREKYLSQMKEKYRENPDLIKSRRIEYYRKNKEAILQKQKESAKINIQKTREQKALYCRKRRACDPMFTLIGRMRCRVNDALRIRGFPKSGKTTKLLGCDFETLKSHLESKFKEGMSWDNRNLWHVDHIVPLASAKSQEELEALFHYKNLQPLWWHENLSKGARIAS